MELDKVRIEKYLDEIINESLVIQQVLKKCDDDIIQSPIYLRGLKYSIILISEAIANTLQHILAKKYNISVNGYSQCFTKAQNNNIISNQLFERLKPFSNFRNMLVHQYWQIDDILFLSNLRSGINDFQLFVKEINDKLVQ